MVFFKLFVALLHLGDSLSVTRQGTAHTGNVWFWEDVDWTALDLDLIFKSINLENLAFKLGVSLNIALIVSI